jgi:hypothetical protein
VSDVRHSKLDLAVIESRWWVNGNSSVKGLFDVLSDILVDNPSAYHYEMFNNAESFREILLRLSVKRGVANIYIAAHGDEGGIYGAATNRRITKKNYISRIKLRNILYTLMNQRGARLNGLFFGSCLFANPDTMNYMLAAGELGHHKIRWIAGYNTPVNWMSSSVVDLFFWNHYYQIGEEVGEIERIQQVAEAVRRFMPGAYTDLGFNIYVRKPGTGGIKGLMNGNGHNGLDDDEEEED